jgi:hypothetical protein
VNFHERVLPAVSLREARLASLSADPAVIIVPDIGSCKMSYSRLTYYSACLIGIRKILGYNYDWLFPCNKSVTSPEQQIARCGGIKIWQQLAGRAFGYVKQLFARLNFML